MSDPLARTVDLDPHAFLLVAISSKVVEKLQDYPCRRIILIAPGWHNMLWFFAPGGHVKPNPIVPVQPVDSTLQSDSSQESVRPESSCLAPRASAIKEQGFSEAVVARIDAPQRVSTRSQLNYLDRTSDLRQNKKLLFVSFRNGFNKDISPASIFSWIKL